MGFLVTPEEAIELIEKNVNEIGEILIPLRNATNQILAEDIYSSIDMPPFDQSAMDGYAINRTSENESEFVVINEIQAGMDATSIELQEGQASRIFTGAMIPKNCISVVQQEHTERNGNQLHITEFTQNRKNIRYQGEQYKKGELILPKGTRINAGVVGIIAGLGVTEVNVKRPISATIITTGDELIEAGQILTPGKIYESNSEMLRSGLEEFNIQSNLLRVKDNLQSTVDAISQAIQTSDLLLISGGISVGDYDFVKEALKQNKVNEVFYKVKQKPGKPLFFGKTDSTSVFALPGNPASALSCLKIYVSCAIDAMRQSKSKSINTIHYKLSHDYFKKGSFVNFLKAHYHDREVTILGAQSSAMLSSFTEANCLIEIPAEFNECKKGELFKCHLI